jgi:phosphatidylserine/phosphatidylglycerophosphate/cardiolipin synthase-like enzyme
LYCASAIIYSTSTAPPLPHPSPMLVQKAILLLYAVAQIVVAKMSVFVDTVRGPMSRAYRNSRIFVRFMKNSETSKSVRRMGHNATVEVYHNANPERDTKVFQNKSADDLFWRFANYGPAFAVAPEDITFLKAPCDFYQGLLDGITRAKHRVLLASLYLGSSEMEIKMIDTVHNALAKNSTLEVTFLLDCMRGKRGGKVPTGAEKNAEPPKSSLKLLQPLVEHFPGRVKISLFHTPNLRGFWKRVLPNVYLFYHKMLEFV